MDLTRRQAMEPVLGVLVDCVRLGWVDTRARLGRMRLLGFNRRPSPPFTLSRIRIAARLALSALSALSVASFGCQDSPPNIVFIIDDQHNPRAMGWTGQTQVETPQLDRLAAESFRFTSAYSASPVCAPARHSIYTGLYPSEHGVILNDTRMRDVETLMDRLRQEAGYSTASIGKMHNAPYHLRRGFEYVLHHESPLWGISHYFPFLEDAIRRRGLNSELSRFRASQAWSEDPHEIARVNPLPDDLSAERWTTQQALEFVRENRDERPRRPFFLHVSYFAPHQPYHPSARYAAMYDPAEMTLPPNHSAAKLWKWSHLPGSPREMTGDDVRWMRSHYFGLVTQVDAEIGRLLDGLEALDADRNTIVIFTSDHGDMLGEHGRFYKGVMYEAAVRVPLLIRWPGASEPRTISSPVSHVDLVPTLLAAAGLEVGDGYAGRDLRPLLTGRADWAERPVYSEFFTQGASYLMLRNGPYKLIASAPYGRWADFQYQLFDVVADPWELSDLSRRREYREVMAELRVSLAARWERQRRFLPAEIPQALKSPKYDIAWPADPRQPVLPEISLSGKRRLRDEG